MRDRLLRIGRNYIRAFNNLNDLIKIAKDDVQIDASIKRFELCYELAWKLIKEYLADLGIICLNPRSCFHEGCVNGLIDNEENWLSMIEDRNRLVHIYNMKDSRSIFVSIKEKYINSLYYLKEKIIKEYPELSSEKELFD